MICILVYKDACTPENLELCPKNVIDLCKKLHESITLHGMDFLINGSVLIKQKRKSVIKW